MFKRKVSVSYTQLTHPITWLHTPSSQSSVLAASPPMQLLVFGRAALRSAARASKLRPRSGTQSHSVVKRYKLYLRVLKLCFSTYIRQQNYKFIKMIFHIKMEFCLMIS